MTTLSSQTRKTRENCELLRQKPCAKETKLQRKQHIYGTVNVICQQHMIFSMPFLVLAVTRNDAEKMFACVGLQTTDTLEIALYIDQKHQHHLWERKTCFRWLTNKGQNLECCFKQGVKPEVACVFPEWKPFANNSRKNTPDLFTNKSVLLNWDNVAFHTSKAPNVNSYGTYITQLWKPHTHQSLAEKSRSRPVWVYVAITLDTFAVMYTT